MKELTSKRMNIAIENQDSDSVANKASSSRTSLPPTKNGRLRFDNSPSRRNSRNRTPEPRHRSSKDILQGAFGALQHRRSASDNLIGNPRGSPVPPGRATPDDESPPAPPPHRDPILAHTDNHDRFETASASSKESGERTPERTIPPEVKALAEQSPPPQPVAAPPTMAHGPSHKPVPRPQIRPGNAEMDKATLSQLEEMSRNPNRYQSPPENPQNQGYRDPRDMRDPRDPRYIGPYGAYADRSSWNQEEEHPTSIMQQHYQYPPPSKNRYQNHQAPSRLATIPASPYVDQTGPDSAKTPTSYFPNEETIPEVPGRPPPPPHSHSHPSVSRKPLPSSSSIASQDNSRPNTAPGADENPANGFTNPSPRKTPSPIKQRGEDRILQQQAPRMQNLGPAFDPRRPNMGDGSFGGPLGIAPQGGDWTRPGIPTSNSYDHGMLMGRGNPGGPPLVSNLPPQMQLPHSRSTNLVPSNANYGLQGQNRPPPPMMPPGASVPQIGGFQQPMQGPIPMRGGPPPNNGPYPPPHMMTMAQPRPYDNMMMAPNQNTLNQQLPQQMQQQMPPHMQQQMPPQMQQQQQQQQQMQPQQPYAPPRQSWV
jgi:hypothetical protein